MMFNIEVATMGFDVDGDFVGNPGAGEPVCFTVRWPESGAYLGQIVATLGPDDEPVWHAVPEHCDGAGQWDFNRGIDVRRDGSDVGLEKAARHVVVQAVAGLTH